MFKDFWNLAAKVSIETATPYIDRTGKLSNGVPKYSTFFPNFNIPFYIGREGNLFFFFFIYLFFIIFYFYIFVWKQKDVVNCSYAGYRIPTPESGVSELHRVLGTNFGLDTRSMTALMGNFYI